MLGAIGRWWRRRQRTVDMNILWPQCVEQGRTLDHAKAALRFHMEMDPAWHTDFTDDELNAFVDQLTEDAREPL